jgi:copper transport protein
MRRWTAVVGAACVLTGVVSAMWPAPTVLAHASLQSSIPAPASVLDEAPDALVLDFDEAIEADIASIQLFDAAQEVVAIDAPTGSASDDTVVSADLPELDDGTYAVVWRVASVDGHVVDGAFAFQIGDASTADQDLLVQEVSDGVAADPSVDRLATAARLLVFAGLVLLVGAGAHLLLAGDVSVPGRSRRLPVVGAVLVAVGGAAVFGLHAAAVRAGGVGDAFSAGAWSDITGTSTGQAMLLRVPLAAALGALMFAFDRRATAWWRSLAVVLAVALLFTFPAAGHPAGESPQALWSLVDAVHLAAIALWLGGLILFAVGGRWWLDHDADDTGADVPVRRFSRMATVLLPVIVATGVAQTLKLAGGVDTLTDTGWGRRLLVKVSVVSVLIAIGAVSRWLLHNVGPASIRRTVVAEAVLGVVVLAVTASLVSLPPEAGTRSDVFSATLTEAGLIVDITVTPGAVGLDEVHLILTPPGGSLTPVAGVTARMALPERDIPNQPVTFDPTGANHYTGRVTLPYSGAWTLELLVEVTAGNTVLLTATVPIP